MFDTFNMGIGFVLLVPPAQAKQALKWFAGQDVAAYVIGEVVPGEAQVLGLPN
jgi:phosphoribosylformylglycinamidine cyclo-ligase